LEVALSYGAAIVSGKQALQTLWPFCSDNCYRLFMWCQRWWKSAGIKMQQLVSQHFASRRPSQTSVHLKTWKY